VENKVKLKLGMKMQRTKSNRSILEHNQEEMPTQASVPSPS